MASEGPAPTADDKARYAQAKKDLIQALSKKRNLDKQLVCFISDCCSLNIHATMEQAQLEVQIYNMEGTYLLDTMAHSGGNIIHGFDGYLKNQITKKRYELNDGDRLFSSSSTTYQKVCHLQIEL